MGGPTGEEEPGFLTGRVFWVLVQRSPFNTEHRGAIPGTMRETLLITSDSEAATTAVLKGDICLRTGRSGSLSSGTTLCRVSFAVFLLRAPPAERESALKVRQNWSRREGGFDVSAVSPWVGSAHGFVVGWK